MMKVHAYDFQDDNFIKGVFVATKAVIGNKSVKFT